MYMARNLKSLLGTQILRKGMWIHLELLSMSVYCCFTFSW